MSPRVAGRLAAVLFLASGAFSALALLLPAAPGANLTAIFLVCVGAMVSGVVAYTMPWDRWPPRATLALLPVAFALIAFGNYYAGIQAFGYSVFFIVAFVWVGLSHPRWTSPWFVPLAAVAYVAPLAFSPDVLPSDISSVALVMVVAVFIAESIAWIGTRDARSHARMSALARTASVLGPHLDAEAVGTTVAKEIRAALGAEVATFVQIKNGLITKVHVSTEDQEFDQLVRSIEGRDLGAENLAILVAGKPVWVDDVRAQPDIVAGGENFGARSYLIVPVLVEDELVGALSCGERTKPRRYTQDDVTLAMALASHASVAIQNAMLYERALDASMRDALTGLENRRAFHEGLETEIARARRYARPLSLIVCDLDRLKHVNDTRGHLAGDRVLDHVAALLRENSRKEDGIYRIGGDEFALVLPETKLDGASVLAERIRRGLERGRAGVDADGPMTVSMGVSSFPTHGTNPDELFERADTAMYEVKRSGRNAVASATLSQEGTPGVRFGVDVWAVIEKKQIVSFYQPIYRLANRGIVGYESLCRLDPAVGSTPTSTLFRAAAALGLTQALDRCCRQAALEGAQGLSVHQLLFMNASPAALEVDEFDIDELLAQVAEAGLVPSNVVIEVTENERTLASRLVRNLEACRAAGFGVSLDDFAAGPTDLELIAAVHFDYVKVDTGLVHGEGSRVRRRLLRGLLDMAVDSGAVAVAEGVETLQDLEAVWELGFQAAQGYFLSDPERTVRTHPELDLSRLR